MKYIYLLLTMLVVSCNIDQTIVSKPADANFSRVCEYTPAPGQFINDPILSGFNDENTPKAACAYADKRLRDNTNPMSFVSLGGWGGYIIVAFDDGIENDGGFNLRIEGNEFGTSSEPGVVWVARDTNGNTKPDDVWYQLKGSEFDLCTQNYEITYTRPEPNSAVEWSDNLGNIGTIDRIGDHKQSSYYPAWITADQHTYTGTLLPPNVELKGEQYIAKPYAWGYADNYSSRDRGVFRIADAVDVNGRSITLPEIHFVKIQSAVCAKALLIGEISTEVCSITNYNILKNK